MSTELLEKVALNELEDRDVEGFGEKLTAVSSVDYGGRGLEIWKEKGTFSCSR